MIRIFTYIVDWIIYILVLLIFLYTILLYLILRIVFSFVFQFQAIYRISNCLTQHVVQGVLLWKGGQCLIFRIRNYFILRSRYIVIYVLTWIYRWWCLFVCLFICFAGVGPYLMVFDVCTGNKSTFFPSLFIQHKPLLFHQPFPWIDLCTYYLCLCFDGAAFRISCVQLFDGQTVHGLRWPGGHTQHQTDSTHTSIPLLLAYGGKELVLIDVTEV